MIEVKNVSKKYKKVKALDNISFNILEGKITCILGTNGVGKSTVLKSICGLVKVDNGEILIDGERLSHKIYDKVAFVPDIDIHFNQFNIKQTFEFMSIFYKNWSNEKAYKILDSFNLSSDDKICNLSKGNKAIVKIILGFAQESKYILLDEPFSGIDIFKREEIIKIIVGYMRDDQGIVITTHEIPEIESIVDEVIFIESGKVVCQFNAEEIRENQGMSIVDKMREVYRGE